MPTAGPLTAAELIALLELKPLPVEGGYFRETYRSADVLPAGLLPRYAADRSAGTAIYYLLTPETFSALHRLPADEVYHFYLGDPVRLVQLFPDGGGTEVVLGPDVRAGQRPQAAVPRGSWQGSFLEPGGAYALMGTTMAPGFDFRDYESGGREELLRNYPGHAGLVRRLTR
jgi:predicted cupin superfamily sugar epimerase